MLQNLLPLIPNAERYKIVGFMVFTSSTEAKYEPYCVFKDKNGGSFQTSAEVYLFFADLRKADHLFAHCVVSY